LFVGPNRRFGSWDRLRVKSWGGGVVMETTIDLSLSRRDFLEK